MRHPEFLDNLDQILERYATKTANLTFEITETACAAKPALLVERISALRKRGLQVSLDDFGTGYSSLGRLQDLNFDVLKIDRMFISRLGKSSAATKIVEAIINVAHLLNISVVAEGVETAEQLQVLRDVNCDVMQGFYFSKPLSPEDTQVFLQEGIPKKVVPFKIEGHILTPAMILQAANASTQPSFRL